MKEHIGGIQQPRGGCATTALSGGRPSGQQDETHHPQGGGGLAFPLIKEILNAKF